MPWRTNLPRFSAIDLPPPLHGMVRIRDPTMQVGDVKPNVRTSKFSPRTAYFLTHMSSLVYEDKKDVEKALKNDLGYDHFHWFEVRADYYP